MKKIISLTMVCFIIFTGVLSFADTNENKTDAMPILISEGVANTNEEDIKYTISNTNEEFTIRLQGDVDSMTLL